MGGNSRSRWKDGVVRMSKLRDKILNAKDQRKEKVYVEEWDAEIEVRSMTGKERAALLRKCMVRDDKGEKEVDIEKMTVYAIISCCYDPETGEKLFEEADRDMLNSKNAGALQRLSETVLELSGLSETAKEKARKN